MGGRFALLIATFEYEDETLRRLEAPRYDVESLASVLRDPAVGEFEVETLINEPLEVVGNAIHEFHRNRRSSDLTLLYFTGHGVKDARGQLYLALKNTRKSNLLFSGLPAVALDESLSECRSREKILVLDCCYSGAFPAGRLAKGATDVGALEQLGGRGRAVLTASDSTQYSFEGVAVNEEGISAPSSVFTRYMVEGLRSGKADLDGDGVISLDELYGYVYDRVLEEAPEQRPKKKDDVEGRIVVAANSRWAVPEYIRSDLMSPIASTRLSAVDALAALYRGPKVIRSEVLGVLRPFSEDDSKQVSARAVEHVERLQAIEQAERERAEQDKAERERAEQDKAERERAEQDKAERERAEQDKAERERAEQDKAERERAEQDKAERERAEQDKAERERAEQDEAERERAEQDKAERERAEQDKAERERAEQDKAERERAEQDKAERERAEQDKAPKSKKARDGVGSAIAAEQVRRERQYRNGGLMMAAALVAGLTLIAVVAAVTQNSDSSQRTFPTTTSPASPGSPTSLSSAFPHATSSYGCRDSTPSSAQYVAAVICDSGVSYYRLSAAPTPSAPEGMTNVIVTPNECGTRYSGTYYSGASTWEVNFYRGGYKTESFGGTTSVISVNTAYVCG